MAEIIYRGKVRVVKEHYYLVQCPKCDTIMRVNPEEMNINFGETERDFTLSADEKSIIGICPVCAVHFVSRMFTHKRIYADKES